MFTMITMYLKANLRVFLLIASVAVCLGVGGMPGGWTEADVTRDDVQDAARFAATELEKSSNSIYASQLRQVVKAQTQVVAGANYNLTLQMNELDCLKRENKPQELCETQKILTCNVRVYVRSWENYYELTKFSCQYDDATVKKRSARSIVGGLAPIELSNTQVQDAVSFVTDHLASQSNGVYSVEFHRLVTGTQQVVAGMFYRLKMEFVLKSCKKTDGASMPLLSTCVGSPETNVIACDVEVIDQAWMVPRHTLKQHRCQPLAESDSVLYFRQHNQVPKLSDGEHNVGSKDEFESFKKQFGKQYSSVEEEQQRYGVFRNNMKIAKQIQALDQGTATYGASQFADLTSEEFQRIYLPRRWDTSYDERLKPATVPEDTPPAEFDWREHGAVTEVKNQGSCGSCWAFSVTGNIEGQWAIKKKQLVPMSEQELVDCDKLDEGCNGGLPSNAYQEIQRLGGLETETDYPYKGDDEKCNFVKQEARFYINGSMNISQDEEVMKAWIYKNGPTSIGINAFAMQFYLGGVSHPWKIFCAPDFLDHGVLIVGYGVKKGWFRDTPYWAIKNSWGPYWGEKGYYLVYRGAGVCGLNTMVSSAVVN